MSFAEQIWLSIVDKALLGGIVALVGFFATRTIEAYKAKQLLRTELTKLRVMKIEEVWKRMFEVETLTNSFRKDVAKSWYVPTAIGQPVEVRLQLLRELWCKLVTSKRDEVDVINAKFDEMILSIQRDSFWLGRNLTQKATEQLTSIRSGFDISLTGDTIKADQTGAFALTTTFTKHQVDVDYVLNNV
jgi:hypothetical protein